MVMFINSIDSIDSSIITESINGGFAIAMFDDTGYGIATLLSSQHEELLYLTWLWLTIRFTP